MEAKRLKYSSIILMISLSIFFLGFGFVSGTEGDSVVVNILFSIVEICFLSSFIYTMYLLLKKD